MSNLNNRKPAKSSAFPVEIEAPIAASFDNAQIGTERPLSSLAVLHFSVRQDRTGTEFSMPEIDMYTKFACPFCVRAKRLLKQKGVEFNEYDITMGGPKRAEMLARAPNAMTVPQIFIGDVHVGGSDDLVALDREGKLDALLAG